MVFVKKRTHFGATLCIIVLCLALAGCSRGGSSRATTVTPVSPAVPASPAPSSSGTRQSMNAADLAEYVQARTVTVTAEGEGFTSNGSGFFIDDNGTLVTCYHVIDGADEITVEISGGGKYTVETVVDCSELHDIAVLQLKLTGNVYLPRSNSAVRTGETVSAVGSSLGFLDGSFSNGVISSSSRTVGTIKCLQTTASISSGNSGGPLVNEYGEVVGVNAFSYVSGDNLNLAISMDTVDQLGMDKNWSISQFREWYGKEVGRSYHFWDSANSKWVLSKVHTYQHVTGQPCQISDYDWSILGGDASHAINGYDDERGVFFYEYSADEFDTYTEYLGTMGFAFLEKKSFTDGDSYYYFNEFNGQRMDLFIAKGDKLLIVEPYIP